MQKSKRQVVALVLVAIGSLAIGATAAGLFLGSFFDHATSTRHLADLSVYNAIDRALVENDRQKALEIVRSIAGAARLGLQAAADELTPAQAAKFKELQAQMDAREKRPLGDMSTPTP